MNYEQREIAQDVLFYHDLSWVTINDSILIPLYQDIKKTSLQLRCYNSWYPERDKGLCKQNLFLYKEPYSIFFSSHLLLRNEIAPVYSMKGSLFYQSIDSKNILSQFVIGNYFLQAGEGLIIGSPLQKVNYSKLITPFQKKHMEIATEISPVIYPSLSTNRNSFSGIAFQMGKKIYLEEMHNVSIYPEIILWQSIQNRFARLKEGNINRLYQTWSDPTTYDKVKEIVSGVVIKTQIQNNLSLGMTFYQQNYNRAFTDTTIKSFRQGYSTFGKYQTNIWKLSGEVVLAPSQPTYTIVFDTDISSFGQSLSYIKRDCLYPLSYSYTRQSLGQSVNSAEINWDTKIKLNKNIKLTTRLALKKDYTAPFSTRWKDRKIFELHWNKDRQKVTITYYQFKNSLLAEIDTLWYKLLPTQRRVKFHYEQNLTKQLTALLSCQYYHYNKVKSLQNGVLQEYNLNYLTKPINLIFGISLWSNLKTTYQDFLYSDSEYTPPISDSDKTLSVRLMFPIGKNGRLTLSAFRPYYHTHNQYYNCNLALSFH